MAGFYRKHKATEVLDEIYARAVLVEYLFMGNIKKRMLLISLDLLKGSLLFFNYIKEQIQKKVNLSLGSGQILIACTHTHHAPDLTGEYYWPGGLVQTIKGILFGANKNDRYIIWMAKRIVTMVSRLVENLQPAEMAWHKEPITDKKVKDDGFRPFILNRRHPSDRTPQDLGVISFRAPDSKRLIGLLVNFGGHPISMSFNNDKISADFPGRVCTFVEGHSEAGGNVGAVYFSGPSGDLNPITTLVVDDFSTLESQDANLTNNKEEGRSTIYVQYGTEEHADMIGNYLGEQALKIAGSIPDGEYIQELDIKSYQRTFSVPVKDDQQERKYGVYSRVNWLSNKIVVFLKKWFILPVAMTAAQEPNFPGLTIKKTPLSHGKGVRYNAYTVNQYIEFIGTNEGGIKKMGIIGVPGELFMDIKYRFLKKSPAGAKNTFIFQIANDWLGYLFPLKEYITKAGYEPFASTTPTAGPYVEKEMYELWKEMKEGLIPFS
ncbi:MAG: neutral/alkaline non-lysosomal ceramidase N-terminal domain-containing protein [Promethearchaeota archaeon]